MPVSPAELHSDLDALYDTLIATVPGATPRDGQREMLLAIGDALADAAFEPDAPARVCVVEAGTGVGKTRAYLAAAITLARRAGVKVVISTSTVALQEQVIGKDLPELAAALEVPPTIALLKGRGRYVCPVKLEQACTGEQTGLSGLADEAPEGSANPEPMTTLPLERWQQLRQRWDAAQWDGERDSLGPDDLVQWHAIAADRMSCTSRQCPKFHHCPYFDAKRAAAKADVLVANHDLVLASLRSDASSLPSGDRAIFVFDEGHHLAETALAHFACEATLSDRRWLQRLEKALVHAAQLLRFPGGFDGCGSPLSQALDELMRTVMAEAGWGAVSELHEAQRDAKAPARVRFPHGVLPAALIDPWQAVHDCAQRLSDKATEFSAFLKAERAADDTLGPLIALQVAEIGPPFKRLSDVLETAQLMLSQPEGGEPPVAKWLDFSLGGGAQTAHLRVTACACPLLASSVLRRHLWPAMRAVVVTSATLRALGSFDHFLRETGLQGRPHVDAREVASPFDHATQGKLIVVHTRASPKAAHDHTAEVATLLQQDWLAVHRGALVLCSSWVQLNAIVAATRGALRQQLRVQGSAPRDALLREHRAAVARGERSILVGLQSFGEGLDLPGEQCEWVFVPKLPFASPEDPVAEARAEWLQAQGRSPFVESVVPATAVRLAQWLGRGIRSETDHATLVCYDPRLSGTSFGRQMLAGLPPFTMVERREGVERPLRLVAGAV